MTPKFQPGTVVATPGAIEVLAESGQDAAFFLDKHLAGDWGEADVEDQNANAQALLDGSRLLSVYRNLKGVVIWVLTEADRSSTCLLLPEDY
jgi:hypothetical protein